MKGRNLTEIDLNFLLDEGIELLCREATESMTSAELLRGLVRDGVEEDSEEWTARCDHWDFHCKQWNRGDVLHHMRGEVASLIDQLHRAADIQRLLVIKGQIDAEMFALEAEAEMFALEAEQDCC